MVLTALDQYLAIYLNDHLAGATGGVELARRLVAGNERAAELSAPLRRVCAEIEEDRATLERVMDRLGVSRSTVKPAAAWLVEKLGRLKLNGRLRGYSPLSRVLELEALQIGIAGKVSLWRTLGDLDVPGGFDFAQLAARGEAQLGVVVDLHRLAVRRMSAD